jgi:magnesium transporter
MKTIKQLTYNGVTWYHLQHPDEKNMAILQKAFNLHPLDIEDVTEQRQRPKLDIYRSYLFFVLHFPVWSDRDASLDTRQFSVFVSNHFLITVTRRPIELIDSLFQQAEQNQKKRKRIFKKSSWHLFYFIVNQLLKQSNPIKKSISRQLDLIDKELIASHYRKALQRISKMRRSLVFLQTTVKAQIPIFTRLEKIEHKLGVQEYLYYWGNLLDKLRSDWEEVEDYYEILQGLSETNETLLSYRTNEIIKLLTIFSVVLMPLNLIAASWGMNISLPFGKHPLAFWILAALMLFLSSSMILYFRKKKWL